MTLIAGDPQAHAIGHMVVALLATLSAFCLIVLRQVSLPSPASAGAGSAVLLWGVIGFAAMQALEALAAVAAGDAAGVLHGVAAFGSGSGLVVIAAGLLLVAAGSLPFLRGRRALAAAPAVAAVFGAALAAARAGGLPALG